MSRLYSPIYIPTFNGNGNGATPAEDQPLIPPVGEATGPQASTGAPWAIGWGTPCPNGNTANNPCGFPWYGSLYLGTYDTYRWMLEHPIIQHARAQVFDPIIAAPNGYEAAKGVPQERVDFVKDAMERVSVELVTDALRALDYGWAPFEKIWEVEDGRYVPVRLKPLRVDTTTIMVDKFGGYAGLKYGSKPEETLNVHKSLLITYDGEFGYLYGRSRLENMRATAWRDWLDAATDLMRLSEKISGIMPVVYTPSGQFKKGDGTMANWSDAADVAIKAARRGIGVHLTHLATLNQGGRVGSDHLGTGPGSAGIASFDQLMAMIKASAVRLEVIDFGTNAPAIASLLERMRQDEERMFAGYFQSPRTGMATQGGTKADAQQHTDTAIVNSENVSAMIFRAINRQLTDDILTINFGPSARGTVWAKPGKLTDANRETDNKILDAVLKDPELGPQYLTQVDVDAVTDRRGIPKLDEKTIVLQDVPADTGETGALPPDGTVDGQGNPINPQDAAAA